jgi:uncharacterized protein
MQTEQRSLIGFEGFETEFRAGKEIAGFAAVYYDGTPKTEFQLTPDIIERVHRGAFDDVLNAGDDVFALYNHKEEMMLGRRSAGSLALDSDARGLRYSVPYDAADPIHQTVSARIKRGDVRGSSVTWQVPPNGQSFERRSDGMISRNIRRVAVMVDVGPTHLPAYTATSAEMRSQLTEQQVAEIAAAARRELLEPPTPIEIYRITKGLR